jgi:hypothetical protein
MFSPPLHHAKCDRRGKMAAFRQPIALVLALPLRASHRLVISLCASFGADAAASAISYVLAVGMK